jgi:hypothetical protein
MAAAAARSGSSQSGQADQLPWTIRRGPRITMKCDCGEQRYLHYGERWTCENCGKTWNTNRIPIEQYAAIRATQLRYRRVPLAVSTLSLICVIAFIIIGKALGGLILIALVATTWNIFFRPRYKRRYQAALKQLPTWKIKPE